MLGFPAPWFAKIFFSLTTFGMGLGIFILGYKPWLCPQLLEKDDKYLIIKRTLGGRICLFKKKLPKKEINWIVPRRYVYRQDKYGRYEKGYCLHLITYRKRYRIGAYLSAADVKRLIDSLRS